MSLSPLQDDTLGPDVFVRMHLKLNRTKFDELLGRARGLLHPVRKRALDLMKARPDLRPKLMKELYDSGIVFGDDFRSSELPLTQDAKDSICSRTDDSVIDCIARILSRRIRPVRCRPSCEVGFPTTFIFSDLFSLLRENASMALLSTRLPRVSLLEFQYSSEDPSSSAAAPTSSSSSFAADLSAGFKRKFFKAWEMEGLRERVEREWTLFHIGEVSRGVNRLFEVYLLEELMEFIDRFRVRDVGAKEVASLPVETLSAGWDRIYPASLTPEELRRLVKEKYADSPGMQQELRKFDQDPKRFRLLTMEAAQNLLTRRDLVERVRPTLCCPVMHCDKPSFASVPDALSHFNLRSFCLSCECHVLGDIVDHRISAEHQQRTQHRCLKFSHFLEALVRIRNPRANIQDIARDGETAENIRDMVIDDVSRLTGRLSDEERASVGRSLRGLNEIPWAVQHGGPVEDFFDLPMVGEFKSERSDQTDEEEEPATKTRRLSSGGSSPTRRDRSPDRRREDSSSDMPLTGRKRNR